MTSLRKPQESESLLAESFRLSQSPASREWGCAWKRCLRAAHVVITSPEGNQWGACRHHVKQVAKAMLDD